VGPYCMYRGGARGKNFEGSKINFLFRKIFCEKFDTALNTYAC
jgi:hypothetical protein